jgi:signal transduction histidine kinase
VLAALVVAWAAAITAFTLYAVPLVPHGVSRIEIIPTVPECLVAPIVGLLIVRRHPRHVVGWLLILQGLMVAPALNSDSYAAYAYFQTHGGWPASQWAAAFNQASWPLLFVGLALIGMIFPTGRFLTPRWRRFTMICLIVQAGYVGYSLLAAHVFTSSLLENVPPPSYRLPSAYSALVDLVGMAAVAALLVGSVMCSRRRLKQATGDERVQMLWFATAALTIPAGLACCVLDSVVDAHNVLTFIGITMLGTVIPVAIGIAILRRGLFDIEVVFSRALTYGLLTVAVVSTYAAVLVAMHSVMNDSFAGLIAVGVVAVAIQPLHSWIRRRVERWVFGDRSDPYAAIRRLSERVDGLADPDEVVWAVTTSVAEALRVSQVWVELEGTPSSRLARRSSSRYTTKRVPLVHQGVEIGELAIDVPAGRHFSAADEAMLHELARHAATVVNAVHLTLELRRSRARLVTAREEERLRLRRDLHDGLGPSLAAMVLKLNAVSRVVDDQVAEELVVQVRDEARGAIRDIRHLVDDLRPPALDEVGLVAALRHRAHALSEAPLLIDVEGPAPMPALPAAVEVAAYRIAVEAMTNAMRHSAASRCSVRIATGRDLSLEIFDNGVGFAPADTPPSVGLSSMRERAEELGGTCTVTALREGGTVVRAVIPAGSGASSATASAADQVATSDEIGPIDLEVGPAQSVAS